MDFDSAYVPGWLHLGGQPEDECSEFVTSDCPNRLSLEGH